MQTVQSLATCVQGDHSDSRGGGIIYYLLHSESVAGPQQPLFQSLLEFLLCTNWKIFLVLSGFFATCFGSLFAFPCRLLLYKIQTWFAKLQFQDEKYS